MTENGRIPACAASFFAFLYGKNKKVSWLQESTSHKSMKVSWEQEVQID